MEKKSPLRGKKNNMKIFARFTQLKERYYCKKANSCEMQILGSLFTTDVGCPPELQFMELGFKPEDDYISGQAVTIDLEENVVEIRDESDYDWETDPVFRMPIEQYRKMMSLWKDLCKIKPKEIIITWDGKEITVEGRN